MKRRDKLTQVQFEVRKRVKKLIRERHKALAEREIQEMEKGIIR